MTSAPTAVEFLQRGAESAGRVIVERAGWLNLSTALLLAGALVLDRMLAHRARASWRMALYAPIALRIVLPVDWTLVHVDSPAMGAVIAPLLEIGAEVRRESSSVGGASYALAAALYFMVAALIAVRTIGARRMLAHVVTDARPVADLPSVVPCPVVEHEQLGPMVVGLVAPRVVIPRRLLAPGQERTLACVLRHELAHLRRRDAWLSLALHLLAVTAWPVVPLWIAMARVRHLMELACDETALLGADGMERRVYGHALVDMAEWQSFAATPLGAGELRFGSTLRARIDAILSQRHWPAAVQVLALAVALASLLVLGSTPLARATSAGPDRNGYGYEFAPDSKEAVDATATDVPPRRTNDDGRMAPELIQARVRDQFPALLACYGAGRSRDPKLAGAMTVRCVIGEDGVPRDVVDESATLTDRAVVGCVLDVFRALRFDESHQGSVTILYPIAFAP